MKFAIIVDDGYGDSAAPAILEALAMTGPVEVIKVSDLISSAGYYFMPSNGFLTHDPARQTRNLGDTWVVNRVVEIGSVAATTLDGNTQILHPNVVLGTYSRILSTAEKVFGAPDRFPACQVLPINMQWHCLRRAGVTVRTPEFAYALSAVEPDVSRFANPVQKDPFDIYNWRAQAAAKLSNSNRFVVDRPAGRPIISYFTGGVTHGFSLTGEEISEKTRASIDALTRDVARALAAFMGEILLFEDGGELTFGALSRYMLSSIDDTQFTSVVRQGFAAELAA